MATLREQVINSIAHWLFNYHKELNHNAWNHNIWETLTDEYKQYYISDANKLLNNTPEISIVNRNVLIDFAKYDILVEQAKEIMNDGWVKEVK